MARFFLLGFFLLVCPPVEIAALGLIYCRLSPVQTEFFTLHYAIESSLPLDRIWLESPDDPVTRVEKIGAPLAGSLTLPLEWAGKRIRLNANTTRGELLFPTPPPQLTLPMAIPAPALPEVHGNFLQRESAPGETLFLFFQAVAVSGVDRVELSLPGEQFTFPGEGSPTFEKLLRFDALEGGECQVLVYDRLGQRNLFPFRIAVPQPTTEPPPSILYDFGIFGDNGLFTLKTPGHGGVKIFFKRGVWGAPEDWPAHTRYRREGFEFIEVRVPRSRAGGFYLGAYLPPPANGSGLWKWWSADPLHILPLEPSIPSTPSPPPRLTPPPGVATESVILTPHRDPNQPEKITFTITIPAKFGYREMTLFRRHDRDLGVDFLKKWPLTPNDRGFSITFHHLASGMGTHYFGLMAYPVATLSHPPGKPSILVEIPVPPHPADHEDK